MDLISSTSSLPEAPPATLFLALELSRSTWLVALHSPVADKVGQHRMEGGDTESLLELIARKRAQAEEQLGRPVRVACCQQPSRQHRSGTLPGPTGYKVVLSMLRLVSSKALAENWFFRTSRAAGRRSGPE